MKRFLGYLLIIAVTPACHSSQDDQHDQHDQDDQHDQGEPSETSVPDGGDTDTGMVEQELVTSAAGHAGWEYYLPMGWFAGLAVSFEAPSPPYEIRSFSVSTINMWSFTLDGDDFVCDSTVPFQLGVWLSEEASPSALTEETAIAMMTASGVGESAGELEDVRGVLDVPVIVEEEGFLIAAVIKGEPQDDRATCAAANEYDSDDLILMLEDGAEDWVSYTEAVPDIRLVLGIPR